MSHRYKHGAAFKSNASFLSKQGGCLSILSIAGNEQNIQLLIYVTERLIAYFQLISGQNGSSGQDALTVNDFLFAAGIDSVNLFHLLRQGQEACMIPIKLCQKCSTAFLSTRFEGALRLASGEHRK